MEPICQPRLRRHPREAFLTARLAQGTKQSLEQLARDRRTTVSALIRTAVDELLQSRPSTKFTATGDREAGLGIR
jgi:predicted transcriptional regulator